MKKLEKVEKLSFKNYAFSHDTKYAYLYSTGNSPLHKHTDFYEFSLITYGYYTNKYQNNSYHLTRNSLVFFRQGEQHSLVTEDNSSIHFSFLIEGDYFENLFHSYFPGTSLASLDKYIDRRLSDAQANYLTDLTSKLLDNSDTKTKAQWANLFLFTALSLCIIRQQTVRNLKSTQIYIDKLLLRLNDYAYLNYSVKDIYKDFPMARSALINLFKKRTGYTIVQYHNKKKMEYAAQLLNSGQHSVTEVGAMMNFDSLSYFAKVFKAHHGVTPKEYQRLHSRQAYPWDDI